MDGEFDWVSLDSSEEVLWSGEPRIQSIIGAIIVGLVLLPLAPLIIIPAYLHIKNTDFVVTSEGLYRKTGIISRNVQKIGFEKVQNISFSQGVFGNYFGYGNIEISTAGGSGVEMKFNSIKNPKEVQELINQRIKGSETPETHDSQEILRQILEELQEINQKLE